MEAVPVAPNEPSGANPSSVKSDDGSPRPESGRESPPPNCAICLGTCRNKSFTDSCLHQFCFKCLLTWSKVKAECPLCKQNFKSIIHNVQSNHQYEEYMVEQTHTEETLDRNDIVNLTSATRRFRYRTTLTLPRRESMAIQQLLLHYPMMADVFPSAAPPPPPPRRRRSPAAFRRTVYRHNLWARPLPDFTGRFRDCTPLFYRYNDSQMHRLIPWLNRELHYLLNENVGHISYVMSRILELLPQHGISSPECRAAVQRYLGARTELFLHELYVFASTPYDLAGYDRNVQYTTDSRVSSLVSQVLSSSDSDLSADSDIVVVSSSHPAPPAPTPAPAPAAAAPPPPAPGPSGVVPIETISHSDTDESSGDVTVVGYIKPPAERTPEVVDLLGSDSDVVLASSPAPAPAPAPAAASPPRVRVSLKRRRSRVRRARRRSRSASSASPSPARAFKHRRRRNHSRAAPATTSTSTSRQHSSPEPGPSTPPRLRSVISCVPLPPGTPPPRPCHSDERPATPPLAASGSGASANSTTTPKPDSRPQPAPAPKREPKRVWNYSSRSDTDSDSEANTDTEESEDEAPRPATPVTRPATSVTRPVTPVTRPAYTTKPTSRTRWSSGSDSEDDLPLNLSLHRKTAS